MYTTVEEVVTFTGVKYKTFGLSSDEELEDLLEGWVSQAEDLINTYLNRTFTTPIPSSISNVCLRLVGNMVKLSVSNRDTPIRQADDFTIEDNTSNIFTEDLRQDLQPYRRTKTMMFSVSKRVETEETE